MYVVKFDFVRDFKKKYYEIIGFFYVIKFDPNYFRKMISIPRKTNTKMLLWVFEKITWFFITCFQLIYTNSLRLIKIVWFYFIICFYYLLLYLFSIILIYIFHTINDKYFCKISYNYYFLYKMNRIF